MNSRGFSEAYLILIYILAVAIILVGTLNQVDKAETDFIQRTFVTENVALISSAASFYPGNIEFTFFSPKDHMKQWDSFPLETGDVFTYKDPENDVSTGSTYKTFLSDEFIVQEYFITTEGSFATINKQYTTPSTQGGILYRGEGNPLQLRCTGSEIQHDWTIHTLYGGKKDVYYSDVGQIITGEVSIDYDGMTPQYYIDGTRVFAGNPGKNIGTQSSGDVLLDLSNGLTRSYGEDAYIPLEVIEEPHLVLSITNEEKNSIIAKVSANNFDIQYETACQLINGMLYDESIEGIERVAIVPYDGMHLVLSIGSTTHPDFFSRDHIVAIHSHLRLFTEGGSNAIV